MSDKCIRIWWYDDAPEEYRTMFDGGDGVGEWLLVAPPAVATMPAFWMIHEIKLGTFKVKQRTLPDGTEVYLGMAS